MGINENERGKTMWEIEKETTRAKEYFRKQKGLQTILSLEKEELIDGVSLCQLCFEYDLYHGEFPEHPYEGLSLYKFFHDRQDEDYDVTLSHVWEDELEEHRKKEQKEEGEKKGDE